MHRTPSGRAAHIHHACASTCSADRHPTYTPTPHAPVPNPAQAACRLPPSTPAVGPATAVWGAREACMHACARPTPLWLYAGLTTPGTQGLLSCCCLPSPLLCLLATPAPPPQHLPPLPWMRSPPRPHPHHPHHQVRVAGQEARRAHGLPGLQGGGAVTCPTPSAPATGCRPQRAPRQRCSLPAGRGPGPASAWLGSSWTSCRPLPV